MINNELEGFVIYKPHLRFISGLFATINKNGVRFSHDCCKAMGDWVLIFFDENKQRIMLQPAKKGTANAVKLSANGGAVNTLIQKTVVQDIRKLAGLNDNETISVWGHKCNYATTPSIIFNLNERREL